MRKIDVLKYFKGADTVRISRVSPTSDIPEIHPIKADRLLLHYIADAPGWITLFKQAHMEDDLHSFGTGLLGLFSPALQRTPIAIWLQEDVGPKLEELTLNVVKVYAHISRYLISANYVQFHSDLHYQLRQCWPVLGKTWASTPVLTFALSPSLFHYLSSELKVLLRGSLFSISYPICLATIWRHFTSPSKAKNLMISPPGKLRKCFKRTTGEGFPSSVHDSNIYGRPSCQ